MFKILEIKKERRTFRKKVWKRKKRKNEKYIIRKDGEIKSKRKKKKKKHETKENGKMKDKMRERTLR